MSLEVGGRADKVGNTYENHFLATLLLRLLDEEFISVEVEPLGVEGSGVEYIATKPTGTCIYYQCKASNGDNTKWSVADLNRVNTFKHAKEHLLNATDSEYRFISPLPYAEIGDLCERARTNHSEQDFIKNQLSNEKLRTAFKNIESYLGLNRSDPTELRKILSILSRCYFELVPDGKEAGHLQEAIISHHFTGKAASARSLLANCVNENKWYGINLTAAQITEYMGKCGHCARTYGQDERILPRFKVLNTSHWGPYTPINGALFQRDTSNTILQHIVAGRSVILHGRAGSGKSGCIENVIKSLQRENIVHLCIKLDAHIPNVSADEFGQDLGLPESPIYCLHRIAGNQPSVLILDQLDSLRWTSAHSANAMAVCREIIDQAQAINLHSNGKISIVFAVRSFDYKHDNGIKNLFSSNISNDIIWESVELDVLSDKEVAEIVGAKYCKLSPRIKKLLRTPSSLYIWSQLSENTQSKSIKSVNQLMNTWWEQILGNCQKAGVSPDDVVTTVNAIVSQMNALSVFSLPRHLFTTKVSILDALVSNGILSDNTDRVSFAHQSFLDYFLATEAIQKILQGSNLVSVVDRKDSQTPESRYRLLSVLQDLYEIDSTLFIAQCKAFLCADSVRYYYKCAVFETIAKDTDPDSAIMNFAKDYLLTPEWHDYVLQTVYLGNSVFIKSLSVAPPYEWTSDKGLQLLKSIDNRDPDFVVNTLSPFCFTNANTDHKIYHCLCHDVAQDSSSMFALRLSLLNTHADLIHSSWSNFYRSFQTAPDRCISYLHLLLKTHATIDNRNIHFPDAKIQHKFALDNAPLVVKNLLPILLESAGTVDKYCHIGLNKDYDKWAEKDRHTGSLRKIVNIVRWAIAKMSQDNPVEMTTLLENLDFSKSLVGNELVFAGLEKLPLQHANFVIAWLVENFEQHAFDYTSNSSDYLGSVKRILRRFSGHCDVLLYQKLEHLIIHWHDDTERMVNIYKHRISTNKEKQWFPVYYTYWGHMQKELLPCLDASRRSTKATDLLAVVNRNEWIRDKHYYSGFSFSGAKNVVSPIAGYEERISDKTWLQIINAPTERMGHHKGKETATAFIEATPMEFAASLSKVAVKYPFRFAKLALSFPSTCYPGYVSAVLQGLQEKLDNTEAVDFSVVCDVIRKFSTSDDEYVRTSVANVIAKQASESWPKDIINIVKQLALASQKAHYVDEKDSAWSMQQIIINTPRGCALRAIAHLLWEHPQLFACFKDMIATVCCSVDESVRFAAVSCLVASYNCDPSFAACQYRLLLEKDARVLTASNAWDIIFRDYESNRTYYQDKLIQACSCIIPDIAEHAAGFICGLAIYYSDSILLDFILNNHHTDGMVNKIGLQAAYSFDKPEYHVCSKKILLHLAESYDIELIALSPNFFKEQIVLERDHEFLIRVLSSRTGTRIFQSFLSFLSETDQDITKFADALKTICSQMHHTPDDYRQRIIVDDLIECVVHLYDNGKADPRIKVICLDIWDELFRNNLHDIQPLADMLDSLA